LKVFQGRGRMEHAGVEAKKGVGIVWGEKKSPKTRKKTLIGVHLRGKMAGKKREEAKDLLK